MSTIGLIMFLHITLLTNCRNTHVKTHMCADVVVQLICQIGARKHKTR